MGDGTTTAGGRSNGRSADRGFTLVELLVVITILGILAAIVVFAVSAIKDHGQQSACREDYKEVVSAEEAYFAKQTANASYAVLVNASSPLVTGGLIHEPSKWYDVPTAGPTGYTVDLTAGSPCFLPPA